MTIVRFFKNQRGITGFEAIGHTGYDDLGKDIVCAAISVLTQTTVIGLQDIVQVDITTKIDDGYLRCDLPVKLSQEQWRDSQLVIKILFAGLAEISKEYKDFLRIEEV